MGRRNVYFNPKVKSEQNMFESIIVESLKIYGQEVWYLPRRWQNMDTILGDDPVSSFDKAIPLMMYIENSDGFSGEGDLFAKFGVEIRDESTFVLARREWLKETQDETDISFYRPREGDLIYLKMSDRLFQIEKTEDESPFYQLQNLPVFRMTCSLFENNGENFETGMQDLDDTLEVQNTYRIRLGIDSDETFDMSIGDNITVSRSGETLSAEVINWDAKILQLDVIHVGMSNGEFDMFVVGDTITDENSGTGTVTSVTQIEGTEGTSQNEIFEQVGDDFIDFSESNPFGDIL